MVGTSIEPPSAAVAIGIGTRDVDIGSIAPEHPVRCHGDENIKIARAATPSTRLAFAGKADAGAVLDTGGDGDLQRCFLSARGRCRRRSAHRVFDHLTRPITGRDRSVRW